MQFERKIKDVGSSSLMLIIPPDVCKWMEIEDESDVVMQTETVKHGKHGKFVSFWKKVKE